MEQTDIGRDLFEVFVKDRIQTGTVNIWEPMKKGKLRTWKTVGKKIKIVGTTQTVELREDRNLFARMLLVCKSRPQIDVQEAVSTYEFTVVPRSMFAVDGSMLHCSLKSALMHILENLHGNAAETTHVPVVLNEQLTTQVSMKVSIIDGMAEVQSLDKPERIKNCSDLSDHFALRIFEKYQGSDVIRVIIDRYEAMRLKRQGNAASVYYHITSSTHIVKITMKKLKLLSHVNTKKKLTEYFAQKIIETAQRMGRNVVVSWACECKGTTRNMTYLKSNQEEADTKIILHALDATTNGASEIKIHSPDTDVFILALRRFPRLCQNTVFVTGKGKNRREIQLKPIVDALGPIKTTALPAFHALSGGK